MVRVKVLRNLIHEHLRPVGAELELELEHAERLAKEGLVEIEKASTGRSHRSKAEASSD